MNFAQRLLGALRPRQNRAGGPTIEDVQKAVIAAGDDDAGLRKLLAVASADLNSAALGSAFPVVARQEPRTAVHDNATYPLVLAALKHKPRRLKALPDAGASVDVRTGADKTPLHWAVKGERDYVAGEWRIQFRLPEDEQAASLACTRQLLEGGADPNALDSLKRSPLHYAVLADGKLEHIQMLIAGGANVDAQCLPDGAAPLLLAAELNRLDATIALLEAGAHVNLCNQEGHAPLHRASHGGHADLVLLLLRRGADPNLPDCSGNTPTRLAIGSGSLKTLRHLLEMGAAANLPEAWETHLLQRAVVCNNTESLAALAEAMDVNAHDANGVVRWYHALGCRPGVPAAAIGFLIDRGASCTVPCATGSRALHLAVEHGHLGVTELLLARGADIEQQDGGGYRALHWAAQLGHLELTQLLLERGADPMATADGWKTPLALAVAGRHAALVAPLLAAVQKSGGLRNLAGFSVLNLACEGGQTAIVQQLLRAKPDLDSGTKDGWTPLLAAIGHRGDGLVKLLLAAGADPNAPSETGYRPLHRAAAKGRLDLVRLLIEHGAEPTLMDISGSSLRAYAESTSNKAVIAEVAALMPPKALSPQEVTAQVMDIFRHQLARAPAMLKKLSGQGVSLIDSNKSPWVVGWPGMTTAFVALYQRLAETFGVPRRGTSAGWVVETLSWIDSTDRNIHRLTLTLADGATASIDVDVTACAGLEMRTQAAMVHRLVAASVESWDHITPEDPFRMLSAVRGHPRLVSLQGLTGAVAQPGDDPTALKELLRGWCPDLGRQRLALSAREHPLLLAAMEAKPKRLEALLRSGACVDVECGSVTALHCTVGTWPKGRSGATDSASSLRCALLLLGGGANPDIPDSQGRTPLHAACIADEKQGHLHLLLSIGARVDARCAVGRTPLMEAVQHGREAAVEALLAAGADTTLVDSEARTPTLEASRHARNRIAAMLAESRRDHVSAD